MSNFEKFQQDFVVDTKLSVEKNMDKYIQYYQGKINENILDSLNDIRLELVGINENLESRRIN